ncbi:MAG: hypothetical protein EPN20_17245 [Magnetospirillum sp.]|nr:MAG: hypothetical protein EPN20_17245 [Magnetospirillum sp.]
MGKTFMLGVGCQRGGTTWLHNFLSSHPQCVMSLPKELHIFDAALMPDPFILFQRERIERVAGRLRQWLEQVEAVTPVFTPALRRDVEQIRMTDDFSEYVAYFDRLLAASPGRRLTGEISPSYATLEAGHFRRIRGLMESAGYRIRVVFLMRDPIERIYSHLRLDDAIAAARGAPEAVPAHLRFKDGFAGRHAALRTRYHATMAALDGAFAAEQIFYGFSETLFSPAEVDRLCRFLGIAPHAADFAGRLNGSDRLAELPPEDIRRARHHYAETYDACAARFGCDFIAAIWRHWSDAPAPMAAGEA